MISPGFANFFVASTGAAAALAGLLFVAISVGPQRTVARDAPAERQAVASSAFTAMVNAFFISLGSLIPDVNAGGTVLVLSLLSLLTTLRMGSRLRRGVTTWRRLVRRLSLVLVSAVIYAFELWYGLQLLTQPQDGGLVRSLAFVLLGVYAIGLARAWELLGARREGLWGWLSPLQDVDEEPS